MSTKQAKLAIAQAFVERPDLAAGLVQILDANPTDAAAETLAAVAGHVAALRAASSSRAVVLGNGPAASPGDPTSKKRKLQHNPAAADLSAGARRFDVPDTSFSAPVRKKLRLVGTDAGVAGLSAAAAAVAAGDPARNGAPQGGAAGPEAALAWADVAWIFCLPVPDKAKPSHNFVALPRDDAAGAEAMVWTAAAAGGGSVGELVPRLDALLQRTGAGARSVVLPNADEFVSRVGKGGAFGTRAHRGSKEGYLFFLGPGILWAFKKPILFLPFHNIGSISYTSVLQRTFNLVVTAREKGTDEETEIEFAMVDQDDFAGIDAYVKRHGLNDASLAASRRAKTYNVNASRGAAAAAAGAEKKEVKAEAVEANGAEDGAGETELQKAERMLQDQEDEMEEDYVEEDEEEGSSDDESYAEGEEGDDGDEGDEAGSDEGDEAGSDEGGDDGDDGEEVGFAEEEEFDEEAGGYEDE